MSKNKIDEKMNEEVVKNKTLKEEMKKKLNNPLKEIEKKKKEPKKDFKKLYKESNDEIERLNKKIRELIFDNNKNIDAFQAKAKGFQEKAQKEINKVKDELKNKVDADLVENKKYGAQKLLENILDPIINIDIAITAGQKQDDPSVNAYVQGFRMISNQLFVGLEDSGVVIINPKIGDSYDPEMHYASSTINGEAKNTIKSVQKKGFMLHDRVIKPAVVIVVK